jgi:glutamyl-tRNA synthetase
LRDERERAEQRGEAWQYDRACLKLPDAERKAREAAGSPSAVRFLVRDGHTSFDDAVKGRIEFDTANIEDFVILRSDGLPTYHLSVVVDDVEMKITDVIRGDDHISNTPKHVLLFEALGAATPRFAHVPLILGQDKKRPEQTPRRHVGDGVRPARVSAGGAGQLPRAAWLVAGDDRELMTRDELVASFSLDKISGGNAVFNTEKLDWMNAQYLARMPVEELARYSPSASRPGAGQQRDRSQSVCVLPPARAAAAACETADRLRRTGPAPDRVGRGV